MFESEDLTLWMKVGNLVMAPASAINHPALERNAISPALPIYGKVTGFRKEETIDVTTGESTNKEKVDVDWAFAMRNGYRFRTLITCRLQDLNVLSLVVDRMKNLYVVLTCLNE